MGRWAAMINHYAEHGRPGPHFMNPEGAIEMVPEDAPAVPAAPVPAAPSTPPRIPQHIFSSPNVSPFPHFSFNAPPTTSPLFFSPTTTLFTSRGHPNTPENSPSPPEKATKTSEIDPPPPPPPTTAPEVAAPSTAPTPPPAPEGDTSQNTQKTPPAPPESESSAHSDEEDEEEDEEEETGDKADTPTTKRGISTRRIGPTKRKKATEPAKKQAKKRKM